MSPAPTRWTGLADRQLDTALDDARTDGVAGETGHVMDVQLLHETLPVLLDRFDAERPPVHHLRKHLPQGLIVLNQGEPFRENRQMLISFFL
jgi:hypothetical protein